MYYFLVIIAVVLFGGCFALNDAYQKLRSSSLAESMALGFIGSIAGLAILLPMGGFKPQFTLFTLLIALLSALNGMAYTFCSLKALERVNLSLYSLFAMLGGMVLPFLQGIIFYGEKPTLQKFICLALIGGALALSISKEQRKCGFLWYAGIFVLNGMSGVLSKIFAASTLEKTSAEWFSIWGALFTALLSGILWLSLSGKKREPYSWKAFGLAFANGGINRFANFLLVIALVHLDASIQYPMITGGVIIVSTVICFFRKEKPKAKELLAVALSFIGLLILAF